MENTTLLCKLSEFEMYEINGGDDFMHSVGMGLGSITAFIVNHAKSYAALSEYNRYSYM